MTSTHHTGELLSLDGAMLLESALDSHHLSIERFFCHRRHDGDPRMGAEPPRAGAVAPERRPRSVATRRLPVNTTVVLANVRSRLSASLPSRARAWLLGRERPGYVLQLCSLGLYAEHKLSHATKNHKY